MKRKNVNAAVPVGELHDRSGRLVKMTPGRCLFCGEHVETGREEVGATWPLDPCWNAEGDFGCPDSPENDDDGTGGHMRPFDLALRLLGIGYDGKPRKWGAAP